MSRVRGVSVRRELDVLKVKIVSDQRVVFEGAAPINDKVKVASLLSVLRSKGVSFPKDGWW